MKLTVFLTTEASFVIDVEVPDGLDKEAAEEKAIELAYDEAPHEVCAQCSGWRQPWSLELGEWEPNDGEDGAVTVYEEL